MFKFEKGHLLMSLRNEESLSKMKINNATRETTTKKKYRDVYKRKLSIVRGYDQNQKHYLHAIALNLHDFYLFSLFLLTF